MARGLQGPGEAYQDNAIGEQAEQMKKATSFRALSYDLLETKSREDHTSIKNETSRAPVFSPRESPSLKLQARSPIYLFSRFQAICNAVDMKYKCSSLRNLL